MTVIIESEVFIEIMDRVHDSPEDIQGVISTTFRKFGIENITELDIIEAINESIVISELSETQRRKFLH